jgi:hypothetical protein
LISTPKKKANPCSGKASIIDGILSATAEMPMRRIQNPPEPAALMATARSFGNYDLAAALADLIDNSIHAGAAHVHIDFVPDDNDVVVRIRDDGSGMDEHALIKAMRPASANPDTPRHADDLGRFGWGLKSASLSQARALTVATWTGAGFHAARWDIDDLQGWSMDLFSGDEAANLLASPPNSKTGTEVIWTRCDRLLDAALTATLDERLNEKIAHARHQLSLVFHRYLAGEIAKSFKIFLQGIQLSPSDPFMSGHAATQTLGDERITVRDGLHISVTPYIIPHFSKLSVTERDILGGAEGMVRNQGFYVYRNKRLIIYGTWFRLVPHGELSQLMRVRVDLPNNLDAEWKITLDKSDAQLPVSLRRRLKDIIKNFSKKSSEVHRRRGANINLADRSPIWTRNVHKGRIRYLINRDHPLIEELIDHSDLSANQALKIIESCVPIEQFVKDAGSQSPDFVQSITDPEDYEAVVHACFLVYIRRHGSVPTIKQFLAYLKKIEPFASHWKYTESFIRERAMNKWSLQE